MLTFSEIMGDVPPITVVDVGASAIDGAPVYAPLMNIASTRVIGFEPDPASWQALQANLDPAKEIYLPYALGDGRKHTLRICAAPGMSSIFEPNPDVLGLLPGFPVWGQVAKRLEVETRRLAEVPEARDADFLKLDIQGAELLVLRHAGDCLANATVLQIEVEFMKLYREQPLFSDVDQFMRRHGFTLHRLANQVSRMIAPLQLADDPYRGLSQIVWADAIYIPEYDRLGTIRPDKLLRAAAILHDCYGSWDVAMHFLARIDQSTGSALVSKYLEGLKAADRSHPATHAAAA